MADVISEYQKWKQQGENLKAQAQQAMELRFRELLAEAVSIAEEYRADFGAPLKPSSPVTEFRYRTSGKPKAKKPAKQPVAKTAPRSVPEVQASNPTMVGLQRRLENTRKKLENAKAAGIEDSSDAVFAKMMHTNFNTAVTAFRAVLPVMIQQRSGRIIAIAAEAARVPTALVSAYAASKAALYSLVQSVNAENNELGVFANALTPLVLDTDSIRDLTAQQIVAFIHEMRAHAA